MKYVPKGPEPPMLSEYRRLKPAGTWKAFCRNRAKIQQVQDTLLSDQGGLCAYCEINLAPQGMAGLPDLRVEHFHPKSVTSGNHNWHLDWDNLLATCHGGSQGAVVEPNLRYTSLDHSCDVPKGGKNLDSVILNPRKIPHSHCLFLCRRYDGSLAVNILACEQAGIDPAMARATIIELRLNAPRLCTLRKPYLDKINEELRTKLEKGIPLDEARAHMATLLLVKNTSSEWPRFFTSIRSYLGLAAEKHLVTIGYSG